MACFPFWIQVPGLSTWENNFMTNVQILFTIVILSGKDRVSTSWQRNYTKNTPQQERFLSMQLFDFQQKGVERIKQYGSTLLADEMGLGKTVQAIVAVTELGKIPALVICPKAVIENWKREIEKWDTSAQIITTKTESLQNVNFYIINYDIVIKKLELLQKINYQALILDEIHYVKNYKVKRTKAVEQLANRNVLKIGLSGTPILNHGTEIHQIAKLIDPSCLGNNFFSFITQFGQQDRWGGYVLRKDRLLALNEKLKKIMLRRIKTEVLTQLPEKLRQEILIEVDDHDYRKRLKQYAIEKNENLQLLGFIAHERRVLSELKIDSTIDFVLDRLAETDQKIVIFAHHTDTIKQLSEKLTENKILNTIYIGEQSQEQRNAAIEKFKNEAQVIIISIHAGGTGINLQFANYVIFHELDWSPAQLQQAEDRCHRIGQNSNVNVYYLIAKNTMDMQISARLVSKLEQINAIIDGEQNLEREKLEAYKELLQIL